MSESKKTIASLINLAYLEQLSAGEFQFPEDRKTL